MARKRDFTAFGWLGSRFLGRRRTSPTVTAGVPGVAVYAGYPQTGETSPELGSHEVKYRTYSNILANTAIVAAGVRYFLNMMGGSKWSINPAEGDEAEKYSELLEQALKEDARQTWQQVVRRAAMFRFYGFSVQEITFKRHDEGHFTFGDIAARSQRTIFRWDVDDHGTLMGCVQQNPKTGEDIYLPRSKIMYLVDDTLHDSPEGLGLFRHLVEPVKQLERYEQLEGYGFESDLRGVPIGYAPLAEIREAVNNGELDDAEAKKVTDALGTFLSDHIATVNRGLMVDSAVYRGDNADGETVGSAPKWAVELLSANVGTITENAAAIERKNREIARVLGVEQLLLGATSTGSLALSEDKTHAFQQLCESVLNEIREAVERDLVGPLWELNGWPEEMMPEIVTEVPRHRDPLEMAQALQSLATSGAVLESDDPVINDLRAMMGVSLVDLEEMALRREEDANLQREEMNMRFGQGGPGGNDDDMDDGGGE